MRRASVWTRPPFFTPLCHPLLQPPTTCPRPRKTESSTICGVCGEGRRAGGLETDGLALVAFRIVRSVIQSDLKNFKVTACGLLKRVLRVHGGVGMTWGSKTNTSSVSFCLCRITSPPPPNHHLLLIHHVVTIHTPTVQKKVTCLQSGPPLNRPNVPHQTWPTPMSPG